MLAKYILAVLAIVFLAIAALRLVRDGGRIRPASRTWLIVASVFGLVSAWLWTGGRG